ncbi:MAG: hypothetical protein IJ644_11025 [Oscillospiraceae bacterium]|nr:hypothetical protein [Oscillospiraceae bacterium]
MNDYRSLCCFMYEKVEEVADGMETEVSRTGNLKLRRYVFNMHRMQLDMEELELNMLESGNPPDREKLYFKLFNLITEMIEKMDKEQDLFLIKKYMLDLQRIQMDAEEIYMEQ